MSHSNTMWASQSYLYKKMTLFLVNWVFVRIFFFLICDCEYNKQALKTSKT